MSVQVIPDCSELIFKEGKLRCLFQVCVLESSVSFVHWIWVANEMWQTAWPGVHPIVASIVETMDLPTVDLPFSAGAELPGGTAPQRKCALGPSSSRVSTAWSIVWGNQYVPHMCWGTLSQKYRDSNGPPKEAFLWKGIIWHRLSANTKLK